MSKDKNTRLISALHKVAEMVGTRKEVNGNDIGLGMQLQYNRCMEEARIVTDGLFRVVVMGTFTSGKSTLINALLGSRILPESALPSTAILTFIQFGYDTDYPKKVPSGVFSCVNSDKSRFFLSTFQYLHLSKSPLLPKIL